MKSSPTASDEIKSAFYLPAQAGFHRVAISSTAGGFIPQKADLIEKDSGLYPILSLFLAERVKRKTTPYEGEGGKTNTICAKADNVCPYY